MGTSAPKTIIDFPITSKFLSNREIEKKGKRKDKKSDPLAKPFQVTQEIMYLGDQ